MGPKIVEPFFRFTYVCFIRVFFEAEVVKGSVHNSDSFSQFPPCFSHNNKVVHIADVENVSVVHELVEFFQLECAYNRG